MGLNISKGNMYDFVTHTYNAIKGECYHDCTYCYMKRWGKLKEVRLEGKELRADLGEGNFIFVGSSCDMFADDIPEDWIMQTLDYCDKFDNKYLFQSKNPEGFLKYLDEDVIKEKSIFCTTIETNRFYDGIMNKSPLPKDRAACMSEISNVIKTYATIEPILDFDLESLTEMIRECNPVQVNIGADSGGHKLPEPGKDKIKDLKSQLEQFTIVNQKKNLNRLMK